MKQDRFLDDLKQELNRIERLILLTEGESQRLLIKALTDLQLTIFKPYVYIPLKSGVSI